MIRIMHQGTDMPAKAKAAKELYFRQRLKSRGKQVRKISICRQCTEMRRGDHKLSA